MSKTKSKTAPEQPRSIKVQAGHLPEWEYDIPGAYVHLTYKLRSTPPPIPITRVELIGHDDGDDATLGGCAFELDGHHQADVVRHAVRTFGDGFHVGLREGAHRVRSAIRNALEIRL